MTSFSFVLASHVQSEHLDYYPNRPRRYIPAILELLSHKDTRVGSNPDDNEIIFIYFFVTFLIKMH